MLFRLYNSLMGLAKESLQSEGDASEGGETESNSVNPAVGRGPELVDQGPDTDAEVLVLVEKLKELLKELPKANIATLRYIIRHLRRFVIMPHAAETTRERTGSVEYDLVSDCPSDFLLPGSQS